MTQLLFIVGLQKSGTSLLNRMLMSQDCVTNPFLPEGKFFWGDDPPFSPTAAPCGELFQQHHGQHGHHLDRQDFRLQDQQLLQNRIHEANVDTPILMNKNPYNTVRVDWLKQVFPQCVVVCMVRQPLANVFSLYKKYIDHPNRGLAPEAGWWGIKPRDWDTLSSDDKLIQSAHQWVAVNQQIHQYQDQVDLIVRYDELCTHPNKTLSKILALCGQTTLNQTFEDIKNLDNEYLRGSRLLSKNRELRNSQDFKLKTDNETIELAPLTAPQIDQINHICSEMWQKF